MRIKIFCYKLKNTQFYQEYFQNQCKTVADVPFLDFLWSKTHQGMTENTCKKNIDKKYKNTETTHGIK